MGASEEDFEDFLPNIEMAASIVILRLSYAKVSSINLLGKYVCNPI